MSPIAASRSASGPWRSIRVIQRPAEFGFLKLNDDGRVDEDERARQLLDSMKLYATYRDQEKHRARVSVSDAPTSLIHAAHRFVRRGYNRRYRWRPSDKVFAAIGAAVFGPV